MEKFGNFIYCLLSRLKSAPLAKGNESAGVICGSSFLVTLRQRTQVY